MIDSDARRLRRFGRLLDVLGVAGRRGLTVAAWGDLARSAGPGWTWRQLRAERRDLGAGERDGLYRRIWEAAAAEAGARVRDLGRGFLEMSRDSRSARVWQQVVPLDDQVTLRMSFDKTFVHGRLVDAGVPVPEHVEMGLSDLGPGLEALERFGSVVVKPARGTGGGEGITVGVRSPGELMRAVLLAGRLDDRLLVERQAEGPVHRLLFLDGELVDVVRHHPPRLTGDGRSTVEQLIAAENRRRLAAGGEAGLSLLPVDLDAVLTLRRAGLTLASVPGAGDQVTVKAVTNDTRVEDKDTYRGELADAVVAAARRGVEAVGLRLCGVDVITPDPARPLAEVGGAVTEVNGNPGLHHHYLVSDRAAATPVAVPVLKALLA